MTTTQEKLPEIKIPNLGGLITEAELYYKGKVPYCSWAKTAQRIRENAGVDFVASMVRFRGGQWRIVLTPEQFNTLLQAALQ